MDHDVYIVMKDGTCKGRRWERRGATAGQQTEAQGRAGSAGHRAATGSHGKGWDRQGKAGMDMERLDTERERVEAQ